MSSNAIRAVEMRVHDGRGDRRKIQRPRYDSIRTLWSTVCIWPGDFQAGGILMAERQRPTGKRERIDTTPDRAGGSRFIRRDAQGRFTKDQVDVGRSIAADRRTKAKHHAPKGQKDRGD